MYIRNLNHLMSLIGLRVEIIFTLNQLKAHPLTDAHVPVFEGLRDDWTIIFNQELDIRDGISAASARVVACIVLLDTLAGKASKIVLDLTDDDRTHPLYVAYFKKKSLGQFRKPAMGAQLEAMRGWITQLPKSGVPALVELAPQVEAAVKASDEAVKTRDDLETETTFFREAGDRKKLFDKVNAVRKQTYGELSKMPHEQLGLPTDFASQFFRHESAGDDEAAPTIESVDEEIASLEKQIAQKHELRKELEAQAEAAAKAQEEKEAKLAAIAELEKAAAEAAQKAAEAKAKIAELSK